MKHLKKHLNISLLALLLSATSMASAAGRDAALLQCARTPAGLSDANIDAITHALEQRMAAALGPKWVTSGRTAARQKVDAKALADIADIAGCAAVIDVGSSCAMFFDPEYSTTLGVFTNLSKKTPLRKQFDEALNALPDGKEKAAALSCMKSVAVK